MLIFVSVKAGIMICEIYFKQININSILGNKKYAVISGVVPVPSDPLGTVPANQVLMVSLVVPKFDTNILVKSRMTHTLTLLSSISYSKPMSESLAKEQRYHS